MPCDPSFADIASVVFFDAKRLIGRKFDDAEVQADLKHFPFTVIKQGRQALCQGRVPW